jgi:hypothetical protein
LAPQDRIRIFMYKKNNNMKRGRPIENDVPLDKRKQTVYEFASKAVRDEGWMMEWNFDVKKSNKGAFEVSMSYPKTQQPILKKPEKGKRYGKLPVGVVYKPSNRKNAKTKIKVFKNDNIDYILSGAKLVGIPEDAIMLEVGLGMKTINKLKFKYSL